jgi:PAS domain S-box-containing protein
MKKNPPLRAGNPGKKKASSAPSPGGKAGLQATLATALQRFRMLADNVPDLVYSLDEYGMITALNKTVTNYGFTAGELIGKNLVDLIHIEDRDRVVADYFEIVTRKQSCSYTQQFRILSKSGRVHWLEDRCSIAFAPDGRFLLQEGVCRDITGILEGRNTQQRIREELKALVNIRTAELTEANDELQREILDRRETERILREREADLEMEKGNLEETNTALKVLLKRREEDKHAFEEQVMYNVKEFVLPYLDRLRNLDLDDRQQAYLSILESNLNDITSAFSRRLSLEYYDLTPSERKTANFIRQGKRTRDIAALLGLSRRTIESYRLSIRRKMRLQNRKVNLKTYLSSLT